MASNHGECSPPTSFTLSWQKTKSAYLCGISRKNWYRNICPPANSKTLAEKKWQVMQMLQCGVWYAPKFSQVLHGSEPLHSSVKPLSLDWGLPGFHCDVSPSIHCRNPNLQTKNMSNWRIIPTTGNTVSLMGEVDGVVIQTSPIAFARKGEVKTQNTHYVLGDRHPGLWEVQLEMRRRSQTENLRNLGVL